MKYESFSISSVTFLKFYLFPLSHRVKVREDMPKGTVITNLVAHDADLPASGGEVTYKIQRGKSLSCNNHCAVVLRL